MSADAADKKGRMEALTLLIKLVEKFDGTSDVRVFLSQWETACTLAQDVAGLDNDLAVRAFRMLLTGAAAELLVDSPAVPLPELIAAVTLRFGPRKTSLQRHMELAAVKQQPGCSISGYVTSFERVMREARVVDPGKGQALSTLLM